jgi:hypothetical protein
MRKILAALIGAAATVTMITGAGVAAASPTRPASTSHPASSHRAVTGTEHFQIVSASISGKRSPVVVYGVFNARGVDVTTGNTTDRFKFPGGSFRVTHKNTSSHQHFNTRTCAGTFRQLGTYKLSHGRGNYAGISGHGHFALRGLIVARHTAHGCSHRPIAVQVIIQAHGPVTLP